MNLRGWPFAAVLFGVVSCWSPVYDKDISMATLTASKMDLDASFEVNNFGTTSVGWTRAFASGERQPAYMMILKVDGTSFQSAFWQRDMAGKYFSTANGGGSFRPNVDLDTITVAPLPTAPMSFGLYIPTGGSVAGGNANQAGQLFKLQSPGFNSVSVTEASSTDSLLGFAVTPSWLYLAHQTPALISVEQNASSSTLMVAMSATTPFLRSLLPGTLAVDETGAFPVSYLSQKLSPTSWKTQRLQFMPVFTESTFTTPARVVTFLTSRGQLLMKEAGYFDVCDSSGNVQFRFPAGNLNFSALYLDGGVPRIAFTTILPKAGEGKGSAAEVRVYSIPVAELERLR